MVVGKGPDVSASVDELLRGLGWVCFTVQAVGEDTDKPGVGTNVTDDTATDVLNDGDVVLAEEAGVNDDGDPILRGVALDEEPTGER
ncbi:hypothetical protein [Bifidobacterium miconisargentati]|uniref:hypothetical protein n=1 Tax=Bifidobacterium miconisargentati TaxID=2834437 RepID=UPI001BDC4185|nr:hypothetical protein [Bifidobacterium miconisargentati]MBW3089114.1 hypothetical protein [Bifidobacterium miconisargentati]